MQREEIVAATREPELTSCLRALSPANAAAREFVLTRTRIAVGSDESNDLILRHPPSPTRRISPTPGARNAASTRLARCEVSGAANGKAGGPRNARSSCATGGEAWESELRPSDGEAPRGCRAPEAERRRREGC